MEIVQEKTTLRLRAENSEMNLNLLKRKFKDANTKEEKLKCLHDLDKEIDRQIGVIKKTPETVWDRNDATIKGTIGGIIAIGSIIGAIASKGIGGGMSMKGSLIATAGIGTSIGLGISTAKSDQYHNKTEILNTLSDYKKRVAKLISYVQKTADHPRAATEGFKEYRSAKKEGRKLKSQMKEGQYSDSFSKLVGREKDYDYNQKLKAFIASPKGKMCCKIADDLMKLIKSSIQKYEIHGDDINKREGLHGARTVGVFLIDCTPDRIIEEDEYQKAVKDFRVNAREYKKSHESIIRKYGISISYWDNPDDYPNFSVNIK